MKTVLEIVQAAFGELGLTVPEQVFSSTDAAPRKMLALLNNVCDELVFVHDWNELQVSYSFNTVVDQASYTLPNDFYKMLGNTLYDTTQSRQVDGGITPQAWAYIKGTAAYGGWYTQFKLQGKKLHLTPTPGDVRTLTFDYLSNFWVLDSGTQLPKAKIQSDADYTVYNDRLVIDKLKLRWNEADGLDTTYLAIAYQQTLDSVTGSNSAPTTLSLVQPCQELWNFPDVNFGS